MQISPYSFIAALIGLLLALVHIRIQVHHKLYILSAFSLIYSYIFLFEKIQESSRIYLDDQDPQLRKNMVCDVIHQQPSPY